MAIFPGSAIPSAADDAYTIDNSLRFNIADSASLERTQVSGNRTTWTFSAWVKRGGIASSANEYFLSTDGDSDNTFLGFYFKGASGTDPDQLTITGYSNAFLRSTQVFRDPSAWYHIVVQANTTSGTASERLMVWVNGSEITAWESDYRSSMSSMNLGMNESGRVLALGWETDGNANEFGGYLAEVYLIDGTALDADSFGELDSTTNQWKPLDSDDVKDAVTFGTNGFYQKYGSTELANSFADSTGPWTATSFTTVETTSWTAPAGITEVEYLVIAGGGSGGGGYAPCGGGGAGGYRTGTYTVVPGNSYAVTVGAGGASTSSAGQGNDGSNSTFGTGTVITSVGGGGGGGNSSADGRVGGSGGGSWRTGSGGSGTTDEGNAGGNGCSSPNWAAGGGGGATGAGGNGDCSAPPTGGAGGAGTASSITGSSVTRAGGGGGAVDDATSGTGGPGGSGGGGTGARKGTSAATAGTANTGSGGGGAYSNDPSGGDQAASGAGGSGIVIIRYFDASGTITNTQSPLGRHTITANGDVTNTRAVRKVGDSSIDFDGTGDYLSIPDSSDWDLYETTATTFTYESWIKFTSTPSGSTEVPAFIAQWEDDDNKWQLGMTTGAIQFYLRSGGSTIFSVSGGTITDTNWHHVAWVKNGTSLRTFVDGVLALDTTKSDTDTLSGGLYIGTIHGAAQFFDGYMTEIRVSDVARYTATFTTFGQDGGTISNPTAFTADANTKLLIHSNWTGGLGADSSGNYNTFTPTNLVATDQMPDTPTNSFCTLNPLNTGDSGTWNGTLQEGNLRISGTAGIVKSSSTFALDNVNGSYWEVRWGDQTDANSGIGKIGNANLTTSSQIGADPAYLETGYKGSSGVIDTNGSTEATYSTSADGDIVSFAYKAGRLYVGKVASASAVPTWFNSGDPAAGTGYINAVVKPDPTEWYALLGLSHSINFGQDSSFAGEETAQGNTDANGVGDFYGTVPAGFLALCSDNLSAPEIALPGENFNTVLYTGDGAVSHAITGVGFQPDMNWVKARSFIKDHNLVDSVRGAHFRLIPNGTNAENEDAEKIISLDSDGFTTGVDGATNDNTETYAAWNWKAGGAPTADNSAGVGAVPTAGSVKVDGSNYGSALAGATELIRGSSNTTAGFSVVKYEGDGTSSNSFAHLLSQAPEMIICKNLDAAYDWPVAYQATTDQATVYLDTTAATFTGSNQWNSSVPTSTLVNIGGSSETNSRPGQGDKIVAYCFHSVEGYSKVGRYEGNGSTDGTFVYTGFSPAMVIIKNIDDAQDWSIIDNKRPGYNEVDEILSPNLNNAEDAGTALDFTSNGFKCRNGSDINNDAKTMIYIAFAESPFKTSNAR